MINVGYFDVSWLPLSEMQALMHGSDLHVELKVALGRDPDENLAVVYPLRTYTILKIAITRVTDSEGSEVGNGGTTTDTTLNLSGTVTKGSDVDIYNGETRLGRATPTETGWEYEASGLQDKTYTFEAWIVGSGFWSDAWTVTVQAPQGHGSIQGECLGV
ncbi:hypothetical protein [Pseudomonas purpurea]|uniref:hypothetical protein n=1 Tax=Pseudomonas purpurea TaxID=3136737 RepID=UPI003266AF3E